jgi:HlyD family secretion protein
MGRIYKILALPVLIVATTGGGVAAFSQRDAIRGHLEERLDSRQDRVEMPLLLAPTERVSALGRLEPRHGIRRISGPSALRFSVVEGLLVEEGDLVEAGDLLATIDTEPLMLANLAQAKAELKFAQREYERNRGLNESRLLSDSETEAWAMRMAVADAAVGKAKAELELTRIRAPVNSRVLDIHARQGEAIGPAGILELAETDSMYAIAEVYETDVQRLRPGQRATVSSPALPAVLSGTVEWIALKVDKQDQLSTDPAARKDARVIEVKVRLDASSMAASYTNIQVDVVFDV